MQTHPPLVSFNKWKVPEEEVFYNDGTQTVRGRIDTSYVRHCTPEAKERIKAEFARGFRYAVDLLGENPFTMDAWDIQIKPRGGFGGNGTYWQIPYPDIVAMETDPAVAMMTRSTIVHEFMHHFREEEDVAMFAEIIYLREHGQSKRVHDIQRFYDAPEAYPFFNKKYIWGYQQIARALGVMPAELANVMERLPLVHIKAVFRSYAQTVLREEDLIEATEPRRAATLDTLA